MAIFNSKLFELREGNSGTSDAGGFGNGILRFDSRAALRAAAPPELRGAFGEDRGSLWDMGNWAKMLVS